MAGPDSAARDISLADWARRLGIAGFFAWWRRELVAAVPPRLAAALERRKLRPVIAYDGERMEFWRPTRIGNTVGMEEVTSIATSGDAGAIAAQGRAALDTIFADATGERDVTLALAPRQVLRRSLTLPAAVEGNLRATVGYDLDRLTPFKQDDVAFDAVVTQRDSARRTIDVDLVTVRKRTMEQALASARSFGANVVAVVAAAPREAAASPLNLLSPEERVAGNRFLRWQFLVPLALLVALLLASVVVPLWQERAYAIAMMNAADAASVRAQQSDRLRSELDRMVSQYNFALDRKYSMPGVAQVLDELTRLLPDDTWLTQFEMKSSIRGKATQREVFMRGESANAGKLISLLENATLVGNAAPRSPTTKLQPGPGESFDIGAQLKSVPPPQKIALTEALPAPHANPQPAPVAAPAPVADAKAARPANPAAPEAAAAPAAQPEGAAAARPATARAGAREGGGGGRGRRHLLRGGTREAEAPAATKSAPPPAAEPAAPPPAAAEGMQNAEPAEAAPAEGGGDEPGGGDDNGEESQ